jgi:hypothetical protein
MMFARRLSGVNRQRGFAGQFMKMALNRIGLKEKRKRREDDQKQAAAPLPDRTFSDDHPRMHLADRVQMRIEKYT